MLKRIGRLFILTLCLAILVPLGVVEAREPEVSVSVDRQSVLLGDSIILTITVRGDSKVDPPALPPIPHFDVKFRGARQESFKSFQLVIQGGKIQQKRAGGGLHFDYELIPSAKGSWEIPPLSIPVGGKTYRTQPIQIHVVDETEKSESIFLVVETDKDKLYLGEKALVTFKWYFREDIADYRLNVPWLDGLENMLVTDPELDPTQRYQRFILNDNQEVAALKTREFYKGQQYAVISFQKILTPLAIGNFRLEPVFLKSNIIKGYTGSKRRSFFDDFFKSDFSGFSGPSMGRQAITEPFATRSNPLALAVNPVPEVGKPAGFTGALGSFNFDVKIKPLTLTVGEPITLTMKISGWGNIDTLKLPMIPDVKGFKSYEPESKTDVKQAGGGVSGERIFEKVFIPRKAGSFEIPSITFTYFDPELGHYKTIQRGPFSVEVEKGEREEPLAPVVVVTQEEKRLTPRQEIKILERDIRYIKSELGSQKLSAEFLITKAPLWGTLLLLPVLALTGLSIWQRKRERFQTDVGYARQKGALGTFKRSLKEVERDLKKEDSRHFYDSLSKALNQYLADKLQQPLASMSHDAVSELKRSGLDEETGSVLQSFYNRVESSLYSSFQHSKEDLEKDLKLITGLISKLEKVLKI